MSAGTLWVQRLAMLRNETAIHPSTKRDAFGGALTVRPRSAGAAQRTVAEDRPPAGCERLAIRVLLQAVEDLALPDGPVRRSAAAFLFVPNGVFDAWCEIAGLNPEVARAGLRRLNDQPR